MPAHNIELHSKVRSGRMDLFVQYCRKSKKSFRSILNTQMKIFICFFYVCFLNRVLCLKKKCMSMNDFETACSYLIVLQNTENNKKCEEVNFCLKVFFCIRHILFIFLILKVGQFAFENSIKKF